MGYLANRRYTDVIKEIESKSKTRQTRRKIPKSIKDECYLDLLQRLGRFEIASDFIFLRLDDAIEENKYRDAPRCKLGEEWWVFAVGGSGDGWLIELNKKRAQIAFLDHDEESDATPIPMTKTLKQWFRMADLVAQDERLYEERRELYDGYHAKKELKMDIISIMDKISKGLSKRFPYKI